MSDINLFKKINTNFFSRAITKYNVNIISPHEIVDANNHYFINYIFRIKSDIGYTEACSVKIECSLYDDIRFSIELKNNNSIYIGGLHYYNNASDITSEKLIARILTIDNFSDEYYMEVIFDEIFNYIDMLYDILYKKTTFIERSCHNYNNIEQLMRDKKLKDIEKYD